MYLVRAKVSEKQFHIFTTRLWLALGKVSSLEELRKYKMSVRQVWAQASTDERLYRAEKIAAEYRFLHWKFTKHHKERV